MNTPINQKAPVKCQMTVSIKTDCSVVWQTLTDINKWPFWNKEIIQASLKDELAPGASFVWKSGGVKIRSLLHTVEQEKKLGWTGKTLGIYAVHNWELMEENGMIEVFVEESMEGVLVRLFKKSFSKTLENGMRQWLDALKQESEKKPLPYV